MGICGIPTELLKAVDAWGLHAVLAGIRQSSTIPRDLLKGVAISERGKRIDGS